MVLGFYREATIHAPLSTEVGVTNAQTYRESRFYLNPFEIQPSMNEEEANELRQNYWDVVANSEIAMSSRDRATNDDDWDRRNDVYDYWETQKSILEYI